MVVQAKEGDTVLTLKELAPVRLLKNRFFEQVTELYATSPTKDQLIELLGRARAKKGMFEGDLEEGELEIGQISGLIHNIKPAAEIIQDMLKEFEAAKAEVASF
jgi:enoyl-[acyl-carrier protein] reductase II